MEVKIKHKLIQNLGLSVIADHERQWSAVIKITHLGKFPKP